MTTTRISPVITAVVGDPVGGLIRSCCRGEEVRTRVARLARYPDSDAMFDHESPDSVDPTATREEQLANIRQTYPPEREAVGVVAIGIELADSAGATDELPALRLTAISGSTGAAGADTHVRHRPSQTDRHLVPSTHRTTAGE